VRGEVEEEEEEEVEVDIGAATFIGEETTRGAGREAAAGTAAN